MIKQNPLLSTLIVWGLPLYDNPATGEPDPTSLPVLKTLVSHYGDRVTSLHLDQSGESYHARTGFTAGCHAVLPATCFDSLGPITTGPRMPETEGDMPRADPFVGRLVRFTNGLSLPVSTGGPLMLCVVGWDEDDWSECLAVLVDGLVPGSLRQLSISSTVVQNILDNADHQLSRLQDFLRTHGTSVDCLHLGDQGDNYSNKTERTRMLRSVLPSLPNLVTLRVGLKYGALMGHWRELTALAFLQRDAFGGVWEELAALFFFLDKHCPTLQHLHIWHDVIFWNDPVTFRLYQRSNDNQDWCADELELTLSDVCAAIRRVLGRLTSLDNLPPGLAAFMLGQEEAEATTVVDKDRTHANFKLRPKIIVTPSDPERVGESDTSRADKATSAASVAAADVPEDMINALFAAVERGSLDEVRELVDTQGVPVSVENSCSRSPLHAATLLGHGSIVKFLLQHHAKDNGSAFLAGNAQMRGMFTAHGYGKTGKSTLLERCNTIRTPTDLYAFLLKHDLGGKASDEGARTADTLTASERLDQWRRVIFMAVLGLGFYDRGLVKLMHDAVRIAPETIHTRADWRSIVHVKDNTLPCPAYPKTIAILRSQRPDSHSSLMWTALAGCLLNAPHDVIEVELEPVLAPTTLARVLEKAVAVTLHKGVPEPFCFIGNKGQSSAAALPSSGHSTVDFSVPGTGI